jgi:uncharacterized membrane protein
MKRTTLLALIIALTLIGLADSVYLSGSAMSETPLVCDIQGLDECNTVAESPYSRLWGVPLAVFGLGFYGAILVLAGYLWYRPSRIATHALTTVALLGAAASLYFLYLQVFLIQAVCVYCLVSAAVAIILAGLTLTYSKRLVLQPPVVLP